MRLTCPNCGAEYETPEGLIPAGGKHVQCTACHTRWFARGAQAALSEDQILARLETRGARPRPTLVMVPEPEPETPPAAPEHDGAPDPKAAPELSVESEAEPGPEPDIRPALVVAPASPALVLTPAAAPGPDLATPPRDTGRLRLDTVAPEPPAPAPVSRFGRGFGVAMALVAVAAAAYVWRAPLAATTPSAAPALRAYGDAVDAARDWIDQRLNP